MAKKKTMIEGFWDRLEECIYDTNETKVDIASKIGCNRKVLYDDLDGRAPHTQVILRFCAEYGVSLGYICGISKDKEVSSADQTVVEGFWDRFNECIEDSGESKAEVARRIGCDRKSVYAPSASENRMPSLLYIARFCSSYNYSPEYLVGTSNNMRKVAA